MLISTRIRLACILLAWCAVTAEAQWSGFRVVDTSRAGLLGQEQACVDIRPGGRLAVGCVEVTTDKRNPAVLYRSSDGGATFVRGVIDSSMLDPGSSVSPMQFRRFYGVQLGDGDTVRVLTGVESWGDHESWRTVDLWRSTDGGATFKKMGEIGITGIGILPRMAISGRGEVLVLVEWGFFLSPPFLVCGRGDGLSLSTIVDSVPSPAPVGGEIAGDSLGTIYASWLDQTGVLHAGVSRDSGATYVFAEMDSIKGGSVGFSTLQDSVVAVLATRSASEGGAFSVTIERSLDRGATYLSPVLVGSRASVSGRNILRYAPQCGLLAAWQDGAEVTVARSGDGGASFSPAARVDSVTGGILEDLALDDEGDALVAVTFVPEGDARTLVGLSRATLPTGVALRDGALLPLRARLFPCYPNPFNPVATIRFELPARSAVTLRLVDVLGRIVRTLVEEDLPPGQHAVRLDASGLASGIYYCQLITGRELLTRAVALVR